MVTNKSEIILLLQTHKDEMVQRFGVVSVGLFGSYARGEAREDSDIDIAEQGSLGSAAWGLACKIAHTPLTNRRTSSTGSAAGLISCQLFISGKAEWFSGGGVGGNVSD